LLLCSPALGVKIVEYLRLTDTQRLCCASKGLNEAKQQTGDPFAGTGYSRKLRFLFIIYHLDCADFLRCKIPASVQKCPYQTANYCLSAGPIDPYGTIVEALSDPSLLTTEDNLQRLLLFENAHPFDLEHQGLGGDEYDDIEGDAKFKGNDALSTASQHKDKHL
jgi:hypothetical protein